jgi:hypothetical protein
LERVKLGEEHRAAVESINREKQNELENLRKMKGQLVY